MPGRYPHRCFALLKQSGITPPQASSNDPVSLSDLFLQLFCILTLVRVRFGGKKELVFSWSVSGNESVVQKRLILQSLKVTVIWFCFTSPC